MATGKHDPRVAQRARHPSVVRLESARGGPPTAGHAAAVLGDLDLDAVGDDRYGANSEQVRAYRTLTLAHTKARNRCTVLRVLVLGARTLDAGLDATDRGT